MKYKYLVRWEIDSDCDNPEEAAHEAFIALRDSAGEGCSHFTVVEKETGIETEVSIG